jgi:hypothetical protein
MSKYEFSRRLLTCQEFSLGPIRWRSTTMQEAGELDTDIQQKLQSFAGRLQALIHQARSEGCTAQELHTILSQHTLGDHHGDA